MADLRAPDPTLDAARKPDDDYMRPHVGIEQSVRTTMPVAHLVVVHDYGLKPHAACDDWPLHFTLSTAYARWFAVPCRDCFTDAPPPGQRTHGGDRPPDDLAWQVPDREHADA